MSFHTNYSAYLKQADPQHCVVCNAQPMPARMVDIVKLPHSWLNAESVDCLKGACHLIAKQHVLELYEFDDLQLLDFMKDLQACARALHTVSGAVKLNYEIHGNSVPHLHVHLYPRTLDDPFPGQPIDYTQRRDQYAPGEFERFVAKMRDAIRRSLAPE